MKNLYSKIYKKIQISKTILAIVFVLIGVGLRFIPHAPNFSPITDIALFAGVYFSRKLALALPLLIMVISDIFIGYYETFVMFSVYGSFLICVALGFWLKRKKKWYTIMGGAVLGAVLFFIITNFAVWISTSWYVKTATGLFQCYFLALPFFKNTLLSNLFYVPVFFGIYELSLLVIKSFLFKKYDTGFRNNSLS